MKSATPLLKILCALALMVFPWDQAGAQVEPDGEEETILVGRISYIHGQLLRYDAETGDWTPTVKDAPFGVNDVLLTAVGGRAEMIMPNNTWVRMDGDTQIQLIELSEAMTEVDVSAGKARLYNNSSDTQMKISTPFGTVEAPAQTAFDCSVGQTNMEVIALKGTVHFVHSTGNTRHEVMAGSTGLSADVARVAAVEGSIPPGWNQWNRERDNLWAERMDEKGKSAEYLPPGLQDEAYVLEQYGTWERVYYDGAYYHFWRPVHISVGWAPFTVGRWYRWCGDHVWLSYEPFGYLTHHYGNWIFTGGYWYWAPPVARFRVYVGPPFLNIGFCWYPGRVGWIYYGAHVGWFPLAPCEPYYGYRRWGRYSHAVAHRWPANWHRKVHHYRHRRHAVIIHRNHFYRASPYHRARIRGVSHDTVLHRYHMAPTIHRAVKENYRRAIQTRPRFNRAHVRARPDPPVIDRAMKTRWAQGNRHEVSRANTERRSNIRYKRGRRIENTDTNIRGKRDLKLPERQHNSPLSEPRTKERRLRKNKTDRIEVVRQAKRRNSPEIVRPQRETKENRYAKGIELGNRRDRRFEVPNQRPRENQQVSRERNRSEKRKGLEIVRPQRMRSESRNAKVIELKNHGRNRVEAAAQRVQEMQQRPRLRDRSDRLITKIERSVMQRQPDSSSMRAPSRARSEWRGSRSSVASGPRGHAGRQSSRYARAGRGSRRFGR